MYNWDKKLEPRESGGLIVLARGQCALSPILTPHTLDFISHSPAQTRRVAARLATLLRAGDVICLKGELGAGKTCFVQGLGQGLDAKDPVTSPSYTLIGEYRTSPPLPPLYHIDLYRIESIEEALAIGIEEYLYGEGICAIEWADRVREIIPSACLWLTLRHLSETKRNLIMQPSGERYEILADQFRELAFGSKSSRT